MAAALPMPSVRKRPFADQAARALQSPTLGILFEGQPMSWSCHISNMKGFLIHHHPETFMQRQSNGHMAMSLACLKPRLQPRQANQCHIIVNGECWVGKFAVWRFPVMQPSDIQVCEACPLPEHAWFVPDNCCICTKIGSGCVSLGGGDYDGDLLMFTSNPILLEFLDCTPSGDFREF